MPSTTDGTSGGAQRQDRANHYQDDPKGPQNPNSQQVATDLAAFQHPIFARMYEQMSADAEQRGTAEHRDRALAGLAGRVIEVGAGNGLNFAHYPDTVTQVIAVEPENVLRALAEKAATQAPVPVRVVAGHADALPAADATIDAAVASLVLCSVPDVPSALAEIKRVLRPHG